MRESLRGLLYAGAQASRHLRGAHETFSYPELSNSRLGTLETVRLLAEALAWRLSSSDRVTTAGLQGTQPFLRFRAETFVDCPTHTRNCAGNAAPFQKMSAQYQD